jgi:SAM-dependent methyltransferase
MLQIEGPVWRETMADYGRLVAEIGGGGDVGVDARLDALTRAYARHAPHAAPVERASARARCPACELGSVEAVVARRPGPLVYGRCAACGHGLLMSNATGVGGPGYAGYEQERAYREGRGEALLQRIDRVAAGAKPGHKPGNLVEVGSGFGFTRAAAERRGIATVGVDVSPEAARVAARLYGFSTFTGTLAAALADPTSNVRAGQADLLLYQFVLEHIADPVAELCAAARALRPRGLLALLVPSMEARELEVFGASYRSFRADHLHLFSRDSAARMLRRAGFEARAVESGCNVHLLRGFLDEAELQSIYEAGRGPDLFVVAEATR